MTNARYQALLAAKDALESSAPWPDMPFADRMYLHRVRRKVIVDLDFLLETIEAEERAFHTDDPHTSAT